ncbi:MAG: type IV pilin N-terminal domain-containing protein [Thermoplasmata archaeon]|nr:type IV pilin N-terminal domain-containing protein [Thermoplasmata archaeon]
MRKVYKKREEDAVSPVIATILMVAITVVLAAVLYVMVIGMSGGTTDTAPAGAVTFDPISGTSEKITFGTFSPVPAPMNIKVIITNNSAGGGVIELVFPTAPSASPFDMGATGGTGTSGLAATYTDTNFAGNAVNAGDFITVTGIGEHTSYTVTIYHYGSDSLCSMVGSTSFSTP